MQRIHVDASCEYLQAPGLLQELGPKAKQIGSRILVLLSRNTRARLGDQIASSFANAACPCDLMEFRGESSVREIDRVVAAAKEFDGIVAVGGGSVMDTAKVAAHERGLPFLLVPTAASSPAGNTHYAAIFTDQHAFIGFGRISECSRCILADTDILRSAPSRLLAAGVGSALAAARAALSPLGNPADSQTGSAGRVIASHCWDQARNWSRLAALAAKNEASVPAFDRILETNLYLAGIALDSRGPGFAHAIGNAWTHIRGCGRLYTGERDAFGLLVQLILEEAPERELREVIDLFFALGLPITFEELGFGSVPADDLAAIAQQAASQETFVDAYGIGAGKRIEQALQMADAAGHFFTEDGS